MMRFFFSKTFGCAGCLLFFPGGGCCIAVSFLTSKRAPALRSPQTTWRVAWLLFSSSFRSVVTPPLLLFFVAVICTTAGEEVGSVERVRFE